MIYNSEEYALQLEMQENQNHILYDEYFVQKMAFIDEMLRIDDTKARINLVKLLSDEKFMKVCSSRNDFAEVIKIIQIFVYENKNDVSKTILDIVHGKDNLIHVLNTLKFMLIRIEFSDDEHNTDLLKDFLNKIPLSIFAIQKMISWCSIDKLRVENIVRSVKDCIQ